MGKTDILAAYFRQRKQLGQPDLYLDKAAISSLLFNRVDNTPKPAKGASMLKDGVVSSAAAPVKNRNSKNPVPESGSTTSVKATQPLSVSSKDKLASLRPVSTLVLPKKEKTEKIQDIQSVQSMQGGITPASKRDSLKELFLAGCKACHLATTRTKWVFGAGNADAPVMVVGEAPGADEDSQGLPFVGAAGQLLTSMLTAIKLDRTKNVFITNVLKCRPPENRNPESAEIQICLPILKKQISIIQPKAILLLGRIAAHSLMGTNESISSLRSKIHDYQGIPVMVIYHPAALLRNAQYKRPTWEDLQKFQGLLEKLNVYDVPKE